MADIPAAVQSLKTLEAVEELNYRCTALDIANLQHRHHEKEIIDSELAMLLCSCRGSDFKVNKDNTIVYIFPSTIRQRLRVKWFWFRIYESATNRIFPALFNGLRIFLGAFLLFSLSLGILLLLLVSVYKRGNGSGYRVLHHHYPIPMLWYFGNPFFRRQRHHQSANSPQNSSFFDDVFEFLFGPNAGKYPGPSEDQRWDNIRAVIDKSGGVVAAELIKPHLKYDVFEEKESLWMRKVVSRLGGEPIATDEGDLLYLFRGNSSTTPRDVNELIQGVFVENRWKFSSRPIKFSLALGLANFVALILIWNKLRSVGSTEMEDISLTSFLIALFGVLKLPLLVYAFLFLLIPLTRYLLLVKGFNHFIEKRNRYRRYLQDKLIKDLKDPSSSASKKFKRANKIALSQNNV